MLEPDPTRITRLPSRPGDVVEILVTLETDAGERFALHVPGESRQEALRRAVSFAAGEGHPDALPVDWSYA